MPAERDDSGSPAPDDRLDSWKEIAAYLKRDVTTVQRWEKRESMPVHRHVHDKLGSVYAFRSELELWTRGRKPQAPDAGFGRRRRDRGRSGRLGVQRSQKRLLDRCRRGRRGWHRRDRGGALGSPSRKGRGDRAGDARIQFVTDFDGLDQAAAISRDGRVAAFLSDRDGRTDVWVTRLGSGRFRNLTSGAEPELTNPSVRTLGFAPDGESVTYWVRRPGANGTADYRHPIGSGHRGGLVPVSGRCGRVRLDARPIASRVSHRGTRRSDVRDERRAAPAWHPDFCRARRPSRPLPGLVARCGVDLLRAGLTARQDGHLADEADRQRGRARDHAQQPRQPSGLHRQPHAWSIWRATLTAAAHGCTASISKPAPRAGCSLAPITTRRSPPTNPATAFSSPPPGGSAACGASRCVTGPRVLRSRRRSICRTAADFSPASDRTTWSTCHPTEAGSICGS